MGLRLASLTLLALLSPAPALASGSPQVGATWVTEVTATSAVLRSEVNPEGLTTTYHFQYIAATAYEANLGAGQEGFLGARSVPASNPVLGSGSAFVPVVFSLSAPSNPLAPGTAYRYRVVAANPAGTTATPPHLLRTEDDPPAAGLADARVFELVSPLDKGGGSIAAPGALFGGGDIQAANAGGGITYGSATAFGDPQGAPPVSQYLSTRTSTGWSTGDLSPPLESGGYGDQPDGAPFRLFSADLGRGLLLDGRLCAAEGTCPPTYSLWSGGSLQVVPTTAGLRLEGATADLGHIVFGAEAGLFEWSGGALEQISATEGATLAAPIGAVSADGSHVYFGLPADGSIHLYEGGGGTRLVPETVGGEVAFQAASADGSLAYFTRGGELYRYDSGAGTSTPIAAGVTGVLAVSADGASVYFQDESGLRLWHQGSTTEIAPGADAAAPSDYPPADATARLNADGTRLAFLSDAPITSYENLDAEDHQPDTEVYLYDADAGSLLCASCNPTGERPRGSATIPGVLVNGTTRAYRPRALSADGRRLFFDSTDKLVGADTDSRPDAYEWEEAGKGSCFQVPGCVSLISGGRGEGGTFLDASEDGSDAFFLTGDSLVPADPGSIDVYDARIGGGLPEALQPIACNADACQPLPSPPEDPTAGSSLLNPGNPAPKFFKQHRRKHHKHKKKHHHRKRNKHGGKR
jgi:hypothetical protein